MPWHPRELEGVLTITMRRNIAQGRVIEGIQVRWGLVSRLLSVLMRVGPWREGEPPGPMHKYYDPRLFDVLDEEAVRMQFAPRDAAGESQDACSAGQLLESGFKVQFVGGQGGGDAADVEEGGAGASRDDGSLCLGNLLCFLLFLSLLVLLLVFLTPHLTHPATPHPTSQQHWHNTLSTTSHHLIKCRLGKHVIKGRVYK